MSNLTSDLMKPPTCYRLLRGWCDGTRHRVRCAGCGAAGWPVCTPIPAPDELTPLCCTETSLPAPVRAQEQAF